MFSIKPPDYPYGLSESIIKEVFAIAQGRSLFKTGMEIIHPRQEVKFN
jgi:hypothetical protein